MAASEFENIYDKTLTIINVLANFLSNFENSRSFCNQQTNFGLRLVFLKNPVDIYLSNFNNRNTRKIYKISSN